MQDQFIPAIGRNGARWRGFYTNGYARDGLTTYVIRGYGASDSKGVVEVRQRPKRKGWDLVLYGEVVGTYRIKTSAQVEAESLLGIR